jgi:hypothetical protein
MQSLILTGVIVAIIFAMITIITIYNQQEQIQQPISSYERGYNGEKCNTDTVMTRLSCIDGKLDRLLEESK